MSFSLPLPAVHFLFDELRLGRVPQPFEVPAVGQTHTERRRIRDAMYRDLNERGAMQGDRPVSNVEDALVTFARAALGIMSVAQLPDGQVFARVCTDGAEAVLVRQQGELLRFEPVRPTAVAAAIVNTLPNIPPARGASMTMPMSAPKKPVNNGEDEEYNPFGEVRVRRDTSAQQRALERVFTQPKLAGGALSIQVLRLTHGEAPKRTRANNVTWLDVEQENGGGPGRYFGVATGEPDNQQLTFTPGDNVRIAQYLNELIQPYLP